MGLVLEGGGMRGVFTSGVLDCFMDNNLYFPYTIGVSAGSSNGLSYTAHQRGRAKYCNIGAFEHHNYIGLKYLFTQGCIMDYDFLFGELPLELYPFDFDSYFKGGQMTIVATNCLTGSLFCKTTNARFSFKFMQSVMFVAIRFPDYHNRQRSISRWRNKRCNPNQTCNRRRIQKKRSGFDPQRWI